MHDKGFGRIDRVMRLFRPALLAAAMAAAACPLSAHAQSSADRAAIERAVDGLRAKDRGIEAFYQARAYRPMWFQPGNEAAIRNLIGLLQSVEIDGWKTKQFKADEVAKLVDRAIDGGPGDVARAEIALSRSFATYVQATRKPRSDLLKYESAALAPVVPTAEYALANAAKAPSLAEYVSDFGWMHSYYGPLRKALALTDDPIEREALRINLERARALPADPGRRYVLVNVAAARLSMVEDGQVKDTMKVVVGKPDMQTPMMAGFIRYAVLNPYWNVPPDIVQGRIASNVIDQGPRYLTAGGYEVLSGWDDDAKPIDPSTVDWRAVQAGAAEARVRQKPGGDNFMGRVKFMFPNEEGIYLHDTPEKGLLKEAARTFSSGCVRLEDATRLGAWLFGKPMKMKGAKSDQRVDLPEVVPVYITYFTRLPEKGQIVRRDDPYGRDATQLALMQR